MLRVSWRNLLARKVRMVMSAFAIVLGVAFVAGTLIFTGAMGNSFDSIIAGGVADVEVTPEGAGNFDSFEDGRVIDGAVSTKLEGLPEASNVSPGLSLQSLFVIDSEGSVIATTGPPGLAFNYGESFNVKGEPMLTIATGRFPTGANEVALLTDTADKAGYDLGETITMVTPGTPPLLDATLVGTFDFASDGLLGASIVLFDTEWMQELFFGGQDVFSTISLTAADGVSQEELRDAVAELLPAGVEARTGDETIQANQDAIEDAFLKYIRIFMLVFAGIALVVGGFLIVNTFSILVAQRSRELALLRALGAARRQVITAVLLEALAVGVIGSTLGLGLGILLARGIGALLSNFGLELDGSAFQVTASTVMWSYALGIIVTLVAALLPAIRGSRVAPISALRDDIALPESAMRIRLYIGSAMVVLGVAAVTFGFIRGGNSGLGLLGLGLIPTLLGVALCAPVLARPVVGGFSLLFGRLFPRTGKLAAQNAQRNPRRTAATASALMIGITLVTMVSIFGNSASASVEKSLETSLKADLIVNSIAFQPFSTDVASQLRAVDGVAEVAELRQAIATVGGNEQFVMGTTPSALASTIDFEMTEGDLASVTAGGLAISKGEAERLEVGIGDDVAMEFQGGTLDVRVEAIVEDTGLVGSNYLVDTSTLTVGGLKPLDFMLMVGFTDTADAAAVTSRVKEITEPLPLLAVKDPGEYIEDQKAQIQGFLTLIYALLALSVVIAVLGVINTLGLSVIERTREVGLLRAVGMSRRQLRTMLRLESIIIAVLGAVLGIVLGGAFGIVLVQALRDDGFEVLAVPWVQLIGFVIAAVVVGILAAVWPGRRAARLDVLQAIATD